MRISGAGVRVEGDAFAPPKMGGWLLVLNILRLLFLKYTELVLVYHAPVEHLVNVLFH